MRTLALVSLMVGVLAAQSPRPWMQKLAQPAPALATSDLVDRFNPDAKAFGNVTSPHSRSQEASDLQNAGLSEHCLRMPGSSGNAPLRHHVSDVVGLRAKEQMRGVHAGPIVASMQDAKSGRDLSMRVDPGLPVRGNSMRATTMWSRERTVASWVTVPEPEPTGRLVSPIDLRPKPSFTGGFIASIHRFILAQSERPWMRGQVEISCAREGSPILEKLRKDNPEATIKACACQHACDPLDPHADETGGVAWDGRCEARCDPNGCNCPSPCDS